MSQLTFLDYVFIIIIVASTALAVTKGLVREIVSLIALVAGFVLAALYYARAGTLFAELARTETIAHLLGFLSIFIGVLLAGALVSFTINRFLKAASLEGVDRLLGAIYGFLRGWAVASILVLALVAFPVRSDSVGRSYFAPYLLAGARTAVLVVPRELRDRFREEYKKVVEVWNTHRSST
jgi:membrane protein required for colicin V production